MMTPPRHLAVLRWSLVVLVVLVVVLAALLVPWSELVTVLTPWVDGPRRSTWS